MTRGLTGSEFDQLFTHFADSPTSTTVFRWEALPQYAIPRDEPSLLAFREGGPRPERSVRTSPWLARIAASTIAGKSWTRARLPADTEYFRWELLAYVESQVAGDRTVLVEHGPDLPDFWSFTGAERTDQYGIVMHYDPAGAPIEFEYVDDPDRLAVFEAAAVDLMTAGKPLNAYLAEQAGVAGAV